MSALVACVLEFPASDSPSGFRWSIIEGLRFELQQPRLDIQPAGKAGQAAIGRDHTMAGNDDRDRVLATGCTHRPARLRRADSLGYFQIALGLAEGNFAQALPDIFLKLGALRCQWQLKSNALAGEVLGQLLLGALQYRITRRGNQVAELHAIGCFPLP